MGYLFERGEELTARTGYPGGAEKAGEGQAYQRGVQPGRGWGGASARGPLPLAVTHARVLREARSRPCKQRCVRFYSRF